MKSEKFSILFVIKQTRLNKQGLCPINFRITYQARRKENATGLFVNPELWDSKAQTQCSKSLNNSTVNSQLKIVKQNLNKAFLLLQLEEAEFTVEDIYNKYFGKPKEEKKYLLSYFSKFLERINKLIGKDIQLATWKKYNYALLQLTGFIKWKFKKSDITFDQLTLQFIIDFEFYLKTERNQGQSTVNKTIQRFRGCIKFAIGEGVLSKDPFLFYKPGKVKKEVVFLSQNELKKLELYSFGQSRLELIQSLFIFCCYTGLAFNEMASLETKHIIKGFDGMNWIQMRREKTQRQISIPILPKAQNIIDKYTSDKNLLFPTISNQKFNSYLKEIAEIIGIEKRLTHHTARKTFASTVLLYNDVPMEIVSELLGHSNMLITQESYGKVVQKKVSEEMKKLKLKINNH
jgi:integrase